MIRENTKKLDGKSPNGGHVRIEINNKYTIHEWDSGMKFKLGNLLPVKKRK